MTVQFIYFKSILLYRLVNHLKYFILQGVEFDVLWVLLVFLWFDRAEIFQSITIKIVIFMITMFCMLFSCQRCFAFSM